MRPRTACLIAAAITLTGCFEDPEQAARLASIEAENGTLKDENRRLDREADALLARNRALEEQVKTLEKQAALARLGADADDNVVAVLDTSAGRIVCTLFQAEAPRTVLNFVQLAEGTRDWTDPTAARPSGAPSTTARSSTASSRASWSRAATRGHGPGRPWLHLRRRDRRRAWLRAGQPARHGQPGPRHQRQSVLHHRPGHAAAPRWQAHHLRGLRQSRGRPGHRRVGARLHGSSAAPGGPRAGPDLPRGALSADPAPPCGGAGGCSPRNATRRPRRAVGASGLGRFRGPPADRQRW